MKLLLTLALLTSFYSYSQDSCNCYERLFQLAEYQSFKGDSIEALNTYKKALSYLDNKRLSSGKFYKLSLYYIKIDKDSSFHYALKALSMGYNKNVILNNNSFDLLREDERWKMIDTFQYKVPSHFNLDYYRELMGLFSLDQGIRSTLKPYMSIEERNEFDSINFVKLFKLIESKGIPNYYEHGFEFQELNPMIMHFSMGSETMFQNLIEFMDSNRINGEFTRLQIALNTDRRNDWKYKKNQTYGMWNFMGGKPIDDVDSVDLRRFEMNLLNLKSMYEILGKELPESYTVVEYPRNYFCD